MSLADAEAHQRKHFGKGLQAATETPKAPEPVKLPKPRQNATEREYGLILEAMKQRGEIVDYRPFGIRLEWGCDPVTGKPMVYSPDFVVWTNEPTDEVSFREVKGGYIRPQDWIRFKGCRSAWPQFDFQLHQKANGEWRRLL